MDTNIYRHKGQEVKRKTLEGLAKTDHDNKIINALMHRINLAASMDASLEFELV